MPHMLQSSRINVHVQSVSIVIPRYFELTTADACCV